jgi:hypothetical protein
MSWEKRVRLSWHTREYSNHQETTFGPSSLRKEYSLGRTYLPCCLPVRLPEGVLVLDSMLSLWHIELYEDVLMSLLSPFQNPRVSSVRCVLKTALYKSQSKKIGYYHSLVLSLDGQYCFDGDI